MSGVRVSGASWLAAALLVSFVASGASAQRRPRAGGPATIEIRGQVPTPQVVTVRPRAVPEFSRQVFVPEFYNPTVFPAVLTSYQIVARRQIVGSAPTDTVPPPLAQSGLPTIATVPDSTAPQVIAPVKVPGIVPKATDSAAAAARQQEIEQIRAELNRRRARLDSLAAEVKTMGQPPAGGQQGQTPPPPPPPPPPASTPPMATLDRAALGSGHAALRSTR